jgi:hypothetical protein
MNTLRNIKAKINEEWHLEFPTLNKFSVNKFYRIIGCVVAGIELIVLPGSHNYRPHLTIHGLWPNHLGNDVKAWLGGPFFLKEFYNHKGLQFNIPFEFDTEICKEAIRVIKSQAAFLLTENISIETLNAYIDDYAKSRPLDAMPGSFLQASLMESKLNIALYVSHTQALPVFEEIKNRSWNTAHFKQCGQDVDKWIDKMKNKLANRELFADQVKANRLSPGLSKLKFSELTTIIT